MSGRVEFDADARMRLGEDWRAEAAGAPVAQSVPRAPCSSATLDARPRAATAVASLAFFVAIGLFAASLHGARDGGFLPHAPDRGAVARGAAAAGRASRGSEVDVRDSVIFAAGTVAAFALSFGAAGAELMVPEKYPTIAAALATATSNDVVSIAPGTYNVGLMRMPSFPITLRGRGDEESVVILGESIEVFAGSGPRRIENLTLRGMTGYAAVRVDGAHSAGPPSCLSGAGSVGSASRMFCCARAAARCSAARASRCSLSATTRWGGRESWTVRLESTSTPPLTPARSSISVLAFSRTGSLAAPSISSSSTSTA